MITDPLKLLREAEAFAEAGEFDKVEEIRQRFKKEGGLIPGNVMEFFESNYLEEELIDNA